MASHHSQFDQDERQKKGKVALAVLHSPHHPECFKPDLVENPQGEERDEDLKRGRDYFNQSLTAIAFQKNENQSHVWLKTATEFLLNISYK